MNLKWHGGFLLPRNGKLERYPTVSTQSNNPLVSVDGVEKVFHRGSEDIHVLRIPPTAQWDFLALMVRCLASTPS
jgi:hypothetical protein